MVAPVRIKLRRTKGWRMPANTVKVDRSTVWGNPYRVDVLLPEEAVERFRKFMTVKPSLRRIKINSVMRRDVFDGSEGKRLEMLRRLPELRGKNLACWCKLPEPGQPDLCHAAVLLELANP